MQKCDKCKSTKKNNEFYLNKKTKKYSGWCLECGYLSNKMRKCRYYWIKKEEDGKFTARFGGKYLKTCLSTQACESVINKHKLRLLMKAREEKDLEIDHYYDTL